MRPRAAVFCVNEVLRRGQLECRVLGRELTAAGFEVIAHVCTDSEESIRFQLGICPARGPDRHVRRSRRTRTM